MATLLLTAVGTAFGGPIGGAIGALAGRQLDRGLFGSGQREGPRLKDLAISTSSYGTPIARHFGQVRAAGTVMWSTDLVEQRETSGSGKGAPKTTSYSYSVSLAVALASSPIDRLGRIWADGALLRGAAGDLKTGGKLRIYHGWGDQPLDPLIASVEGNRCPAFRDLAYVVFEDLQLADFGNRIPVLNFEIFAGTGPNITRRIVRSVNPEGQADSLTSSLAGFSWEGGSVASVLSAIDPLEPLAVRSVGSGIEYRSVTGAANDAALLPENVPAREEEGIGAGTGFSRERASGNHDRPAALRYYDPARDYQPGTQRAAGRAAGSHERTLEVPATIEAEAARSLIDGAAARAATEQETLSWRVGELDPSIRPGDFARVTGFAGDWLVETVEWNDSGVEYRLRRTGQLSIQPHAADPGRVWPTPDLAVTPTILRAFELPPERPEWDYSTPIFVAASSTSAGWPGASLYRETAGELAPTGVATRTRAVMGSLAAPLAASSAIRFEPFASLEVDLIAPDMEFETSSLAGLADGANRLLVEDEVLQFAQVEPLGANSWRLSGLLRGRGGTEVASLSGHPVGAPVTLLDERLTMLEGVEEAMSIAAIGPADEGPAFASIDNQGMAIRPLTPVHPYLRRIGSEAVELLWLPRIRGAWSWSAAAQASNGNRAESYLVGIGPVATPYTEWRVTEPRLGFDLQEWAGLAASFTGEVLWVAQLGPGGRSPALQILRFD